jgi:hypothetical protein
MKKSVTWINGIIFAAGIGTSIMLLFSANSGGDLRHPEIRSLPKANP